MNSLVRLLDYLRQNNLALKEMFVIGVVLISVVSLLHLLWGGFTVTYLWLSITTLWLYLNTKKNKAIMQRFTDIDERDMDFKDEYDKLYGCVQKITKRIDD